MKIIEILLKRLKNDPNYKFEKPYTLREIIHIMLYRIKEVIRGTFKILNYRNRKGILFVGKNVTIKHPYLISFGKSVVIENDVYIDALSVKGLHFDNNVSIKRGATIVCTGVIKNKGVGISIGSNSAIGSNNFIHGGGGVYIGQNVIIGPDVKIFSENHNYSDLIVPIRLQGESREGILIKDDCWIGAGSIITDGVTIESGSIVGAGSVVTKSFPPNSIIVGNPAKLLKHRD